MLRIRRLPPRHECRGFTRALMNQITRKISPAELVSQASIALEDMDDLARMGGEIEVASHLLKIDLNRWN